MTAAVPIMLAQPDRRDMRAYKRLAAGVLCQVLDDVPERVAGFREDHDIP